MKQLLHTSSDGCHVVVALYDTVYYYNNNIPHKGTIHELVRESPKESPPPSDQAIDTTNSNGEVCDHGDDTNEIAATSNNNNNNNNSSILKKPASSTAELIDPQEVQAVAVVKNNEDSSVWCAVARYDKSLSLYCIKEEPTVNHANHHHNNNSSGSNNHTNNNDNDTTVAAIQITAPQIIHRTAKRVSSLSFATVYGQTSHHPILTVIVAGDVVGDATAYSLTIDSHCHFAEPPKNNHEHDMDDGDGNDNEATSETIVTKHRRLLLGHTASMLTSVHVVTRTTPSHANQDDDDDESPSSIQQQQQLILTSDRDEKIRVSRFPDTFCIEGYLLGHTAFVSSVAPIHIKGGNNACVSVGGDCTLRLWDYSTCREIVMASTNIDSNHLTTLQKKPMESEIQNPTNENTETTVETGDSATPTPPTGPIPTKVAVATDGSVIASIYDDCESMDFWSIQSPQDNDSGNSNIVLDRSYRWNCPGQPIGITFLNDDQFLLVMQEPHYIQQYKIIFNGKQNAERTITDIAAVDSVYCSTIQTVASELDIIMSDGLLEKDEYGCLKMGKMSERRGGATIQPWNNIARKETNAERIKRLRKRRREEPIQPR